MEMSIVVMLLGIAVAAFAPLYKFYIQDQAEKATENNIALISSAIGNFRTVNGRYPFPASLTSIRGAANYGREQNAASAAAPGNFDPALGVYIQQSKRAIDYLDPFTAGNPKVNGKPRVRIGFIPFRQLNLDEKQAYDGFGNRILYAVTEHLANDTTFRANEGGISIIDGNGNSVIAPADTAHFVAFSSGKNANGAFSAAGTQYPCNAGPERENCDFTSTSPAVPDAVFRQAQTSTSGNGTTQFDDVMTYFVETDIPLWQLSSNPAAVKDSINQKPGGMVGFSFVANSTPVLTKSDVNGIVRALDDPQTPGTVEAKIMAKQFCPTGPGADCLATSLIAGDVSAAPRTGGLKCPDDDNIDDNGNGTKETGKYMIGIRLGKPICSNEVVIGCPNKGDILSGFDADGNPICGVPPPSCAAKVVSSGCPAPDNGTKTIPASPSGSVVNVTFGASWTITYTCTAGVWNTTGNVTGVCSCTPSTKTQTINCSNDPYYNIFTGTFTQTQQYQCPQGTWTNPSPPPIYAVYGYGMDYPAPASTCRCKDWSESGFYPCPAGLTGVGYPKTKTFTCINSQLGHSDGWIPPTPPVGFESNPFYCHCDSTATKKVMSACPMPLQGTVFTTMKMDCNLNEWVPTGEVDSSGCKCLGSQSWTGTAPCPTPGDPGSILNKYTLDCDGSLHKEELSNSCQAAGDATCQWIQGGSPLGGQLYPSGFRVGSSCTCNTSGVTRGNCHTGSSGNFTNFNDCRCL